MDEDTVKAILDAVREPLVIEGHDGAHRFALVPAGTSVIDLAKYVGPRLNISQRIETLSVKSFCDYVERFGTEETVIFANEPNSYYEAVLDYHAAVEDDEPDDRATCEHIVHYQCPQSDPWKIWNQGSGKMIGQEEFATFIENNLRDILKPMGAEMLQMCLHLQVHKSAQFESGIRLDNGEVQFRYIETVKGTSDAKKAGDIKIPTEFLLGLPVFVDGKTFQQPARFKYRMNEGKLYLGYELIRPTEVFNAAVKQVTAEIAKGTAEHPLYQGSRR